MKYISDEEQPLLDALAKMAHGSSKSTLRSWLKLGRVLVDGKVCKIGSSRVMKGQTVAIKKKVDSSEIQILYSDRHIAVIDKPAGILSVSAPYEKGETAHGYIKRIHKPQKVYPVHRLDRETSGVMVFALTEEAKDDLKKQFEKHAVIRQYYAIVEGHLKETKGTWKSLLSEDKNYKVYSTRSPSKGKAAVTHYRVVKTTKKTTHLVLNLETGKKNQIRVHCQDAGHPVVGDKKYGPAKLSAGRLCLHAKNLEFPHPVTGKNMRFESPLPKEFKHA
jgi:23S rRNA pseudouridine1911/1915/1917 synthase